VLSAENLDYYCESYPGFDAIFRQKTMHSGMKGTQGSTNIYLELQKAKKGAVLS
jgi:hypothetical protein